MPRRQRPLLPIGVRLLTHFVMPEAGQVFNLRTHSGEYFSYISFNVLCDGDLVELYGAVDSKVKVVRTDAIESISMANPLSVSGA